MKCKDCKCYFCQKHREIIEATHAKDVATLSQLAIELGGRAISAEFDSDYYSCILDGSWPTAIVILEKALVKAKEWEV